MALIKLIAFVAYYREREKERDPRAEICKCFVKSKKTSTCFVACATLNFSSGNQISGDRVL